MGTSGSRYCFVCSSGVKIAIWWMHVDKWDKGLWHYTTSVCKNEFHGTLNKLWILQNGNLYVIVFMGRMATEAWKLSQTHKRPALFLSPAFPWPAMDCVHTYTPRDTVLPKPHQLTNHQLSLFCQPGSLWWLLLCSPNLRDTASRLCELCIKVRT